MPEQSDYEEVVRMYKARLEQELAGGSSVDDTGQTDTKDYGDFKKQYMPKHLTLYESICQFSEKNIALAPPKKEEPKLQDAINATHMTITPKGVYSASIFIPLLLVLAGLLLFFIVPTALGNVPNLFFVMFFLIAGLVIMIPLQKFPYMIANTFRVKASNQMVLAVFYIVTYMRHTSNLEIAINFAAEHLGPPLSLDLRKVVWDVETQKYDSIKDSLDDYLDRWRDWNMEFVESIHLIQSSLYESSNERRLGSLDKALNVILNETYEKMLHYAHGLKGPLMTLNMLGVVLPVLVLVILPLVVSFMEDFRWYHLLALYNIALPAGVYALGKSILSTRPGGTGSDDITEKNPKLKKYKNIIIKMGNANLYIKPIIFSVLLFIVFMTIGLLPLIFNLLLPGVDYGLIQGDRGSMVFTDLHNAPDAKVYYYFLGYRERIAGGTTIPGDMVGPFGMGSVLLSLFVPLGIGLSIGLYNKLKTQHLVNIRSQAKKLELEFSSALFQLGTRIGDGIPAEMAFGRVASQLGDTISGKFFFLVSANITNLGMNVEQAIFDKQHGAINQFPSDIIESSMKVLVESSKKGPMIASQALVNVSEYIKQMHRVDERLKDLLGDVISSMKSQVSFLTPVIAGVVVGITSMITKILGTLTGQLGKLSEASTNAGGMGAIMGMFGTGIPTYFFQIVVGLYVVQLAYILTVIGNGIENGPDKVGEESLLGMQLTRSTMTYVVLTFVVIILFNMVSGNILDTLQ